MISLPVASGTPGARVLGIGEHRPARTVTNADLEQMVETSDAWIRERTGIATRRLAEPDETVVSMATAAAGKALAASGVAAGEVDLLLLATCSMDFVIPGGAAQVADNLGIGAPGALDLNAACAGFCYGLGIAGDAVRAGSARNVLVIGSERLSTWVDWTDRSTCIIFADGAGAALVGPSDVNGIGPVVWGSDGTKSSTIEIPADHGKIRMEGQAVYRWAVIEMATLARRALDAAGLRADELAAFVPHQANVRIVDSLAKTLGIDPSIVSRDIVDMGNTSSASVPLALARMQAEDRLPSGGPVLLLGFGAGLTYAGQVVLAP